MKKFLFSLAIIFSATFSLFAAGSDDIFLPDLTTEVEGETKTIKPKVDVPVSTDKFAIPQKEVEPVIVETPEPEPEPVVEIPAPKVERTISGEGLAGGGFPGFFVGDFSVYSGQSENPNPFKINFKHETAEGYFGKPFSSGYNDKTTLVSGEKRFTYKNFIFDFSGFYKSLENGLQSKEPEITSFNQRIYDGNASITWNLKNGFSLFAGFNGGVYNRFADALPSSVLPDWVDDISIFSMTPEAKISWTNEDVGITAYFDAKYFFDKDVKDDLIFGSEKTSSRGDFEIGLSWKNDIVELFGNAGAVVGNLIGDNKVIVPFTVGLNAQIPVSFSDKKIRIGLSGGLSSEQNKIGQLEEEYKFSLLSFMPTETTDWYGKLDMEIPFQSSFVANFSGEFRQTAVDNGVWQPVYENLYLINGGYGYNIIDRQLIKTHGAISYTVGVFTIKAGWLSYWKYVPIGYDIQNVTLDLSFKSKNNIWGAEIKSSFGILADDNIPNIGIGAFVNVKPQVRIAVQVEDTVKLVKMAPRTYAGQYDLRSGSASLLVKFFF